MSKDSKRNYGEGFQQMYLDALRARHKLPNATDDEIWNIHTLIVEKKNNRLPLVTCPDWVNTYLESIEELTPSPSKNDKTPIDFYSSTELRAMGIEAGDGSMIHKQTIIVSPEKLKLGNNVRIDGFCTISAGAGISIGSNVHIAGYVSLFGGAGIEVGDYASIASGAKVYSVSDDVMGRAMVGPQVPLEKRHLHKGKVVLGEHSVLSVNTIVMPGGSLSKGSTLLPFSVLINENPMPYIVLQGVPAKFIKPKRDGLQKLVEELEE